MTRVGFMQGRLCDPIDGAIQAFPKDTWESEFPKAQKIGLTLLEWTLDADGLFKNPLMTSSGRLLISSACEKFNIKVPSLTADCCMQAPFWKTNNEKLAEKLKNDFVQICAACADMGVEIIVLPIVDNSQIESDIQEKRMVDFLLLSENFIREKNLIIALETDFEPLRFQRLMSLLDSDCFGVNYDTGNSAALGYDPSEEFKHVGHRVVNVHIKDRPLGCPTVPLLEGDVDFITVFKNLNKVNYGGNLILQTAREKNAHHEKALIEYKQLVDFWSNRYGV